MPFYWFIESFPDCNMNLEDLEKGVLDRHEAYDDPSMRCYYDFNKNSIDSIGHLLMCIVAGENAELLPKIIRGEVNLFVKRLQNEPVEVLKSGFKWFLEVLSVEKVG